MSVSLSRRVYLKFARNATIFRHFLAHLSYNLAQELRHLTKKGDGKRKKSSLQYYAILCERTDSPKALASVAGYMENGKFHPINDKEVPAFWIYCEGCPPPHGEEQMQKA
jgi:hypothetical protein